MTEIELNKLDRHIAFLRDEARGLRERQGKAQWALAKAHQFDEVGDFLVEIRRARQMTGIGGKRLSDNQGEK